MKILQICNFSSGISGVWTRVVEDSSNFIDEGHEVYVISSNETEDGNVVDKEEILDNGINIKRFPIIKRSGYALWFDFDKYAKEINPDIIICHGLRKPYLKKSVNIARELGAKCFLITHAPFIDKDLRSKKLNLYIWFYDKFFGSYIMNSFNKVISICKWEKPILIKLGCDEDNIEYIPNSLSEEFFTQKIKKTENKILFLGRMNEVKDIDILINAFNEAKLEGFKLEIVSSNKGDYFNHLKNIKCDNVIFTNPIYDTEKKIEKIDECKIFVLPSKKESLPFGLIEAMSRGKIVVSTRNRGALELIEDNNNGFLFDIGDTQTLRNILVYLATSKADFSNIKNSAKNTSYEFRLKSNINKWRKLLNG